MSRPFKIVVVIGALLVTALAYYLIRPERAESRWPESGEDYTPQIAQKGVAELPADPKVLVGRYYHGDGLGYNISLTLSPEGAYRAELSGCLGVYGDAAGDWRVSDGLIVFTPSKESDTMRSKLRALEVLKYQGDWIFVSTNKSARRYYDTYGVSDRSCFQKIVSSSREP